MNEATNGEDRISAPATPRQVLAAGVAVLGLPALAAVALTPRRAALRLGFAEPSDVTAFISGPAARTIGRAGVAVDRVWLASYGAIADHLCVGTIRGGVDAGIMPAGAAERLVGGSEIILLSRLAGGRPSVLVAREGFQADQHGPARLALSSPAHFDVLRRHWPAPTVQQVVLPAPQSR
jgi:ABC-type nitrate/sulfonate/bicarbonate transport system substrate-binding protein